MRTMGRTTKLTPETIALVEHALASGATYRLAAAYAGIGERTLHQWRERKPHIAQRLSRVEATGSVELLEKIRKKGEDDWRALAWILERRYPQEYGKSVVEQQGKDGAAIQHHIEGQLDHSGGITVRAIDYREAIRPLLPLGGAPALNDKDAEEE